MKDKIIKMYEDFSLRYWQKIANSELDAQE